MESNILLESGTGEVELIEFVVSGKHYAINVIKVKEVVDIDNLTKLPQCHEAIAGLTLSRGNIITVVDLKYILEKKKEDKQSFKAIICEFNKVKVAFNIDDIVGVHRIGWDKIMKPEDIAVNSLVIGNIIVNNKIIFMLDFEKIVTDINPNTGISESRMVNVEYRDRSAVKVVLADDSALIRRLIKETLTKAGFTNLTFFDDGKQALDYVNRLYSEKKDNFREDIDVLITDIEMPQMDGHTLTRKIKEHPFLKKIPVIIFSSLITGELKHKGDAVGADAQLSKPEIGDLVNMMDELTRTRG